MDDEDEIKKLQEERNSGRALLSSKGGGVFDSDIYDSGDRSQFATMEVGEEENEDQQQDSSIGRSPRSSVNPSRALIDDSIGNSSSSSNNMSVEMREQFGSGLVNTRITDRESEYHQRRNLRKLSPGRGDAFGDEDNARSYKDIREAQDLEKEEVKLRKAIAEKMEAQGQGGGENENKTEESASSASSSSSGQGGRRRRWDDAGDSEVKASEKSGWDAETPVAVRNSRWDETPLVSSADAGASGKPGKSRWDETPTTVSGTPSSFDAPTPVGGGMGETPSGRKRSRWDETPVTGSGGSKFAETPSGSTASVQSTPNAAMRIAATAKRWEVEIDARNRPMTDEELDSMLPSIGYSIMEVPESYQPIVAAHQKLLATPAPMDATPGFNIQATPSRDSYAIPMTPGGDGNMPYIKPEDYQYFGKLMDEDPSDTEGLTREQINERTIMALLLKIKNGMPPQRKTAMRVITDKAREFGAEALFNQILPLLMAPTLEDQERHLLVKVIDRVLYKLSDSVRPYVHKILSVIVPLLIDEDYYARVEGREIISNLAKAAGRDTMISVMREDIDNPEEYVRNTTARALAVVASALGITNLLPFLKAVCQSKKSWEARQTGIKVIQQIAILMGAAILPHLKFMISIIQHGLTDENHRVRSSTAFAVSALAESAYPYGIEAFDDVLTPLRNGVKQHRSKALAAFLKAFGNIIPLMEEVHADFYTREVMVILVREFQTPDEEMKKVVLKVVQQCISTDGVDASYIRESILPEFFKQFWTRRMALDRRNYKQVVETTVELANKVGSSEIISKISDDLKDDSEPYRGMVMQTIEQIVQNLGAADIDTRLEEQLIDGVLFAFQEQSEDETKIMLSGFGTIINAFGERMKPYLPQVCGTIKWRLNNKSAAVRMQAADLISKIAVVLKICDEDTLMGHLGVVLYEYLGEEYPEVLGSILGALKAIVHVIGMNNMTPPIKDLLPRLTPILKNRHEKVQENCIDLVGRIADRGAEFVSPREWMRICFELLDMLKAKKKSIRRASVNTFGYIAKAIGPQDVLHTLLNNLKVQERTMRVCTTVAIAIVAETCSPFTVLPALMNEYRIPDINVQNGVLKALSFMFEYIGEMGKDYLYAISPLLVDALTDRDNVHRQTAATAVKHLALGVQGMGCEDALSHLLNFVWPNIFEESPHVINATMEAIEGLMVALGPAKIMMYVMQGLFHPARKVRDIYWKLFNSLYIYAQDGVVACYPKFEDEGENTYRRTQLELFI